MCVTTDTGWSCRSTRLCYSHSSMFAAVSVFNSGASGYPLGFGWQGYI